MRANRFDQFLEKAIEECRRNRLLDQTNAAFAALRSDEHPWKDELAERQAWDATLADRLNEA